MKECTVCRENKPDSDFPLRKYPNGKVVVRGTCKQCCSAMSVTSAAKNKSAKSAAYQRWRAKNLEKERQRRKDFRAANLDADKAYRAKYRADNKSKLREYHRTYSGTWRKAHTALYAHLSAKRRAAIRRATPGWADPREIVEVYELAQEFRDAGLDVHVDHIVPIQGRGVSGLHVAANLRVCLADVNRTKSNKHEDHFAYL